MIDGTGYLVPDPVDPGELSCFTVYVPRDTIYLAAFWTAYEFFTTWIAWAKDPLKKGRLAAQVWRRAFDKARTEFDLTGGECMPSITGVRANPLSSCVLQIQIDGGEWTDVFDASCCGGSGGGGCGAGAAMRYNNGTIERWNNDDQKWEPIGPNLPPGDQTSPIGNGVSTSDAACLAATNAGHTIADGLKKFAELRAAGGSFLSSVLTAFQFVIMVTGLEPLLGEYAALLQEVWAGLELQSSEVLALDITQDVICLIVNSFADDGHCIGVAGPVAQAQAKSDAATFESAEWIAWRYVSMWIGAAGARGMTNAGASYGLTEGECDSCPWRITFDFTIGPDGFVRSVVVDGHTYDNAYFGRYLAGQGWKSEIKDDAAGHAQQRLAIRLACEPCHITSVNFEYAASLGGATTGSFGLWLTGDQYNSSTLGTFPPIADTDAGSIGTSGFDEEVSALCIGAYLDSGGTTPPDAFVIAKKLIIEGYGPKPGVAPLPSP